MPNRLEACGWSITGFPTTEADKNSMQRLDIQMEEMQPPTLFDGHAVQ
jgi:hypothetical protein